MFTSKKEKNQKIQLQILHNQPLVFKTCLVPPHPYRPPNVGRDNLPSLRVIITLFLLLYLSHFCRLYIAILINCYAFFIVFLLFVLDFDAFEQRVFRKQPLYLHEVGVRCAYTLLSSDPT